MTSPGINRFAMSVVLLAAAIAGPMALAGTGPGGVGRAQGSTVSAATGDGPC
ncbi:MAG: hypothetical protein LC136_05500 [Burkholderiales bacterium]|nr:hypothetical protein [Burkholderiales bacterium]